MEQMQQRLSDRTDSRVIPFGEVSLGQTFQYQGKTYTKMPTDAHAKNGALGKAQKPTNSFNNKLMVTVLV